MVCAIRDGIARANALVGDAVGDEALQRFHVPPLRLLDDRARRTRQVGDLAQHRGGRALGVERSPDISQKAFKAGLPPLSYAASSRRP